MSGTNLPALRTHRYAALLILLVCAIAVQSFDAQSGAVGTLSDAFRTALGVAILLIVFEGSRQRRVMGAILFAIVALGWWHHSGATTPHPWLSLALHGLMSLFSGVAVWVVLRNLFRASAVGAENVLGAICGYLIAGETLASINGLTYLLVPHAFSVSPDVSALLADWPSRLSLFSYYSFAQLLTIGYADVTPVRAPATTLSLFGALFGLFYTAVVVSQFVGMAGSRQGEKP